MMQLKKRLLLIGGLLAVGLLAVGIGYAAIRGGDEDGGDDEPAAPEAANGNAGSGARDVDRFLMRNGEQPVSVPTARHRRLWGVNAIANHWRLAPAVRRRNLQTRVRSRSRRGEHLVVVAPRRPRAAAVQNPRGARDQMGYDLRAEHDPRDPARNEDPPLYGARRSGRARLTGTDLHGNPIGTVQGYRVAARSCSSARAISPSSRCSQPVRGRSTSVPGRSPNRGVRAARRGS